MIRGKVCVIVDLKDRAGGVIPLLERAILGLVDGFVLACVLVEVVGEIVGEIIFGGGA